MNKDHCGIYALMEGIRYWPPRQIHLRIP